MSVGRASTKTGMVTRCTWELTRGVNATQRRAAIRDQGDVSLLVVNISGSCMRTHVRARLGVGRPISRLAPLRFITG